MGSPALEALKAKIAAKNATQIDSIDDHQEDIKTEKIEDTFDFCGKHLKHKKNGRCVVCDMEAKNKIEMQRRREATLEGTEKWEKTTCFKKDRQTKKYVKRMMGLTGKQYRKLNKKAKLHERKKQDRNTIRKP